MMIATILSFFGCKNSNNPANWSDAKTAEWFNKGDWKNGWNVIADPSINEKSLAVAYFNHKERWDSAFNFLKINDLSSLEIKRHDIDGDNLFVMVSEYNTKNEQDARYEAHKKYIDIQYVARGIERIGIAPMSSVDSVLQAYDATKDVEFIRVKAGTTFPADPGNFFVFFPEDAHMPGLNFDSIAPVKKIVVKVKVD